MKLLTCWEVTKKIKVLLTVMSHIWHMIKAPGVYWYMFSPHTVMVLTSKFSARSHTKNPHCKPEGVACGNAKLFASQDKNEPKKNNTPAKHKNGDQPYVKIYPMQECLLFPT